MLMTTNKKLYAVEEVLTKNGGVFPVSRAHIYNMAKTGQIPTVRVGRRIFIPSWYVEQMLNMPDNAMG